MSQLTTKHIAHSIIALNSERFIKLAIGFIFHVIIARKFGPSTLGEISFAVSFVLIFSSISSLGTEDITAKLLVKFPQKRKKILSELFSIRILGGLISYFLITISNTLFNYRNSVSFFFIQVFGLLSFINIGAISEEYLAVIRKHSTITKLRMCGYMVGSSLKFMIVTLSLSPIWILVSTLSEDFTSKSLGTLKLLKDQKFRISFKISKFKKIVIQKSLPFVLLSFLWIAENRLPYFFFKSTNSSQSLGLFSIAHGLIDMWFFIPITFLTSIYPILVLNHEKSLDTYKERKEIVLLLCFVLGLSLFLTCLFFSHFIIDTIYSKKYEGADAYMPWISSMYIVSFFNVARFRFFTIEKCTNQWIKLQLLFMFLYVTMLYFINYNSASAKGVALSFYIAQIFANICFYKTRLIRETSITFLKLLTNPRYTLESFSMALKNIKDLMR